MAPLRVDPPSYLNLHHPPESGKDPGLPGGCTGNSRVIPHRRLLLNAYGEGNATR